MKIGIAYGHVASNLGDLAINRGSITLLRELYPDATFQIALLNGNDAHLEAAKASFAEAGEMAFCPMRTSEARHELGHDALNEYAQLMSYTHDPRRFLHDSGLGGCDLIVYNSGEHLMSYSGDYRFDTVWRLLPLLAARSAGIRYMTLPVTAGPFEDRAASDVMRQYCHLGDALAVREPHSAKEIATLLDHEPPPVLLDPAFFITPRPVVITPSPENDRLGIIMRLEDFGLRAGTQRSKETLTAMRENGFKESRAYQCSLAVAIRFLAQRPDGIIDVLVQTQHDAELASAIFSGLAEQGLGDRVNIERPETLDTFLQLLARCSIVVSSRFHGCILGTLANVPVIGLYFDSHGHKMPGLFELLGSPEHSFNCSVLAPSEVADAVSPTFDSAAATTSLVQQRMEALREKTRDWVKSNAVSQTRTRRQSLALVGASVDVEEADTPSSAASVQPPNASELIAYRDSLFAILKHLQTAAHDASSLDKANKAHREATKRLEQRTKELQNAQRALADLADRLQQVEMAAAAMRTSTSHRLGRFLATSFTSPWGILLFPLRAPAWAVLEFRRRRRHSQSRELRKHWNKGEVKCDAVLRKHLSEPAAKQVHSMRDLARHRPQFSGDPDESHEPRWLASACELVVQRMQSKRVPRRLALLTMRLSQALLGRQLMSRLLHDVSRTAGDLHSRERTLAHLARFDRVTGRSLWTARWQRVASELHLLRHGYSCPEPNSVTPVAPLNGVANRTLMYLHNSQPFFSGGFATRSQGVLTAVRQAGYEPLAVTRLGFPWDLPGRNDPAPQDLPVPEVIDGISYYRLPPENNGRYDLALEQYLDASAEALEKFIKKHPVSLVHSASFASTCGLPAMKAARRLGLPFIYEVRGLSYLTKVSRMPEWEGSDEYELDVRLERQAANGADLVFTLTRAMKEELVRIGVEEQKIYVFPNCVDPQRFQPMPRNEALAAKLGMKDCVVIGYIGGFVHYEGLDDLLRAFAKLITLVDIPLKLLMVGDGNEDDRLRTLAKDLKLGEHILFTGRLPHAAVTDYYSLVDIAPFPRLPIPVCEIVSPMKPFEAMAMEKTVVVSSVRALAEIVKDGQTGLVFKKRDVDDFVRVLKCAVDDAALRRHIGKAAREWVIEHRTWSTIAQQVQEIYGSLITRNTTLAR